jgi:hypothetical protein
VRVQSAEPAIDEAICIFLAFVHTPDWCAIPTGARDTKCFNDVIATLHPRRVRAPPSRVVFEPLTLPRPRT